MKKTLTALLLCATAATACSTAEPAAPKEAVRDTGTVAWSPCTDLTGADGKPMAPDPAIECGKVAVPLDYAKPGGETIDLALIRVKATGDKLGSLVFNFGGPGGSGVDTLALARQAFAGLGASYDLVSFDPRGVDRSSGVKCGGQVDKLLEMTGDGSDRLAKEFAAACEQDSGKVLPHVGTVNAAQDLDRLRTALGDEKLNYFGLSYGTHLGAVYATKFPANVGRFVLDSAFDPSVTFEERAVIQATGFADAFDAFATDCVAQGCDLGKTPATVLRTVEGLLDDLETKPLKVGDRELTYGLAQLSVITPLYAKATWPILEQATAAALKGDGAMLLALADSYTGRKPDGTYSTMMTSLQAINCVDSAERPTKAETAAINEKVSKIFPVLAADGASAACAYWPVKGTDEAKRIDATGSAPIMVIGGKGDPATPYRWAVSLTEKLKTGHLVTYEGEGHGAYLSGSACVTRTVDSYLLKGTLPESGASCPAA
ncbi:alpha/beta hydrolase [Nonomuraea sp. SBT364]|uniref:alpha/beta hydrolase n=1 Tax=Nonomuraea sp. SBT364 TaxID=1580530 RepID=UPI00066B4640|nr:alpha/beta hydrolase [Nonomuraea sp. SBT364]